MKKKVYFAIDLKSFYASVECVTRGLDPLDTFLAVADPTRTNKTICLALTPPLKVQGLPGRCRLFEVLKKKEEINQQRLQLAPQKKLIACSTQNSLLQQNANLAFDFLIAEPRMSLYIDFSSQIYQIYLRFFSSEDIYVYSIDEVLIDATNYWENHANTEEDFAKKILETILQETGITATAGIAPNLYLAKVALDIGAKSMHPSSDHPAVYKLNEKKYKQIFWTHKPLTDFWRIGRGYAQKLEALGLQTMGAIARFSLYNEELLYKLFGIQAELLIDHAWGYEPTTIEDLHSYLPQKHSLCSGQVLPEGYSLEDAELVLKEMADSLTLDLVQRNWVAKQLVLSLNYEKENSSESKRKSLSQNQWIQDPYGRSVPAPSRGSINLPIPTSSTKRILTYATKLYRKIVHPGLLIRKIQLTAQALPASQKRQTVFPYTQLNFFSPPEQQIQDKAHTLEAELKEQVIQKTIIQIKKKYGKNAIVKGINLQEKSTARLRNKQIGGHKA